MEIVFEHGFGTLAPHEREEFYKKLKRVVVIIEVTAPSNSKLPPENSHGGGVLLNREGCILTCAHLFPTGGSIGFRRANDVEFWPAQVIAIRRDLDLAVIKPINNDNNIQFDFTAFGSEEFLWVGMDVLSVCHPERLYFSFVIGQLAYPCQQVPPPPSHGQHSGSLSFPEGSSPRSQTSICRDVRGIYDENVYDVPDDLHELLTGCLHSELNMIQINNFHGGYGCSGAPIFDSFGRLIGIHSFVLKNFDFAVHLTNLKVFIDNYRAYSPQPPRQTSKGKGTRRHW